MQVHAWDNSGMGCSSMEESLEGAGTEQGGLRGEHMLSRVAETWETLPRPTKQEVTQQERLSARGSRPGRVLYGERGAGAGVESSMKKQVNCVFKNKPI